MLFPINYSDETAVRRLFSWQTRYGMAPKFGTLPIAYYQQDQVNAYDIIDQAARKTLGITLPSVTITVRVRAYAVEAKLLGKGNKWQTVMTCQQVSRTAHERIVR
jgi:hypothetical protein